MKRIKPTGRGRERLALALTAAFAVAFFLIPAAQAAAVGTLKVNIAGTGSGEVSSVGGMPESGGMFEGSPAIECSYASPGPATGTCEDEMEDPGEIFETSFGVPGGMVFLRAIPVEPGSVFVGWKGEEGNTYPTICIEGIPGPGQSPYCGMYALQGEGTGNAKVTATFTKLPLLTVERVGEGTVVSSPAGIECGSTCTAYYESGATVTLTASPAAGWAFASWGGTGCATKVGLTCTVSMTEAKKVKATFKQTFPLTVEKAGSGTGKVTATGISCDPGCSEASSAVLSGAKVKVTAILVGKASKFAGFEGGTGNASACAASPCEFTIGEASTLKAKFELIPTNKLTVNLTGPAANKGVVKSLAPNLGISCSAGCTSAVEAFAETTPTGTPIEVELSASAPTGYSFVKWTGACTGSGACKVPMNAGAKSVTAEFK